VRDHLARLRDAFAAAGYTTSGVDALLGPQASAALARQETVPARRATRGRSALDTLVRLFLLQLPVPEALLSAAVPLEEAVALGLVELSGGEARAALDVRPYGEASEPSETDPPLWWVVSDLGTGLDGRARVLPEDHVLGVGGASTMLAQLTPRDPVTTTVDLGTGCGAQALHAARHSGRVIATDVSQRALRLAAMTAGLSQVTLDLRQGDLLAPVSGEQVELFVTNPPFVVSPAGRPARHTYRDSGLPLDEVCARLVGEAPGLLTPGGTLVMLANWVHRAGQDWRERVGGWLPEGVDAVVVQREVLDPAEYVAMWLRDSGEDAATTYPEAYDGWLAALQDAGVAGVGLGFVTLRRTDARTTSRLVDWPHPVQQPLGPELRDWLDRRSWLAHRDDAAVLASTLRVGPDVSQEQVGRPGAEDPQHVVLRRAGGWRPAVRVDTETAALVGACDGTLSAATLVDAVATVLGTDAAALRARIVGEVRDLVEDGVLLPDTRGPARAAADPPV
jgi:methylase of polypeptide subunit release factors